MNNEIKVNNNQLWHTHDHKPRRNTISIVEILDSNMLKPSEQKEIEMTPSQALDVAIALLTVLREFHA
jgi:hypothetical protein